MINADFSWLIRIYHNYQHHPRSIVFVVYLLRVTLAQVTGTVGNGKKLITATGNSRPKTGVGGCQLQPFATDNSGRSSHSIRDF
jgi:hypothetical protein